MLALRNRAIRVRRALICAVVVAGGAGAVGLAGSLGSVGCSTPSAGGGTGNQNPAGGPIVIGASIGLTGSLDGNAPAMQGGLLAAVQQVNALGGILGRTVTITTQDDTSDPNQALTVAKSLFKSGASVLIGPIGSEQVSTIQPFIQMSKFVNVSATATSTQLTGMYPSSGGYFFRTVPSDSAQALAVGIFALSGPSPDAGGAGCRTMDVVHNNDSYGNPLATSIERYFTANGGVIPAMGDFPVPENAQGDYDSQVTQVLKDLPDCLVLAVYPPTAAQFMQNLSQALHPSPPTGWSKSFFVIGTDGTYDPSLITDGLANPSDPKSMSWVNGTYGPPMYGTVALTNDHNRQQYNDLASIYVAEVGLSSGSKDLDPYTSNEYDAAILTLLAMQAAGTTTDGAAIQKAMFNVSRGKTQNATPYGPAQLADAIAAINKGADINYEGASGNVDFDDYGNVIGDFLVWEVQGSGFANYNQITSTQLAAAQATEDAGVKTTHDAGSPKDSGAKDAHTDAAHDAGHDATTAHDAAIEAASHDAETALEGGSDAMREASSADGAIHDGASQ